MINVIGPYEILDKIGHGGMGVVYRAVHRKIEKEVAIKAIPPQLSQDCEIRRRFLNEAKLQAGLTHPNIVNVINYLESEDSIYLVMEYVNGETLEQKIKREGFIKPDEAVRISEKILDALQYLHNKGIVHRDLKPSNIMFTENGIVKVTDFGISKLIGKKGLTTTILAGSYTYMSPEEIIGQGTTYYSDIYTFGVTLYQMLTGKVPFDYDTEYRVMKAHLEEKPKDLRKHNANITSRLSLSVLRAISKQPNNRYKSPAEFKSKLQDALSSKGFSFDAFILKNYFDSISQRLMAINFGKVPILIFFLLLISSFFLLFRDAENSTANLAVNTLASSEEKNLIDGNMFLNINPELSSADNYSSQLLFQNLKNSDVLQETKKSVAKKGINSKKKAVTFPSLKQNQTTNEWKIRK
ncbi:MAG: serine/threonine-protein kinase [Thermodesulfobacteriota bacterium]